MNKRKGTSLVLRPVGCNGCYGFFIIPVQPAFASATVQANSSSRPAPTGT